MNTIKNQIRPILAMTVAIAISTLVSCKKDEHVPPDINFKTTAGYTAADAIEAVNTPVLFGVDVVKTEDELKTFDVSVSLDGAAANSIQSETISGSEEDGFSRDVAVTTRAVTGTEKYTFTVTDRDGNITQESITLTVQ